MKKFDSENLTPYSIYASNISKISDIENLIFPTKYFILFLAADFTSFDDNKIIEIAQKLINSGLGWVCTFGPECSKAHDLFDLANIFWEEKTGNEFQVMSTWHENEPIEEALWFCLFNAILEVPENECSTIILSINNDLWQNTINTCLSNIPDFNEEIVNS